MQILIHINQTAALRQGVDAPSSTAHVEIDPAVLTQPERDWLAERLVGRELMAHHLTVTEPTLEAVRAEIAAVWYRVAEAEAKKRAERLARYKSCRDQGETTRRTVSITHGGEVRDDSWDRCCHEIIDIPAELPTVFPYGGDPEDAELLIAYDAAEARSNAVQSERERLVVEAVERLRGPHAEHMAERERQKAAKTAEYDALYARLPEPLRARHAAGYASTDEVKHELRRILRADAGYGGDRGWADSDVLRVLTDEEFAGLREIKATAPEGATVTPKEVYDGGGYRTATEDDDPDDIDRDGEVSIPRENVRRVAVIEWRRGGVDALAVMPLVA